MDCEDCEGVFFADLGVTAVADAGLLRTCCDFAPSSEAAALSLRTRARLLRRVAFPASRPLVSKE